MLAWSEPKVIFLQKVKEALKQNKKLLQQLKACIWNKSINPNFVIKKGIL